jgi:hypothetical protein
MKAWFMFTTSQARGIRLVVCEDGVEGVTYRLHLGRRQIGFAVDGGKAGGGE